jgi:hypothetical protein
MKRLLARCLSLLFLLPLGACAQERLVDVNVVDLDRGNWLDRIPYSGREYIEGRPGHRFSVSLRNLTGERVLAVLSVDGVNAISGQTAGASQAGYVLDPFQQVEIRGWRKSYSDVAEFYFTDLPDSYAARTGRPQNVGVIGVAAFREKRPPPIAYEPPPPPYYPVPYADRGTRRGEVGGARGRGLRTARPTRLLGRRPVAARVGADGAGAADRHRPRRAPLRPGHADRVRARQLAPEPAHRALLRFLRGAGGQGRDPRALLRLRALAGSVPERIRARPGLKSCANGPRKKKAAGSPAAFPLSTRWGSVAFRGFLDFFADFLDVLADARDGMATGQEAGHDGKQQQAQDETLHGSTSVLDSNCDFNVTGPYRRIRS